MKKEFCEVYRPTRDNDGKIREYYYLEYRYQPRGVRVLKKMIDNLVNFILEQKPETKAPTQIVLQTETGIATVKLQMNVNGSLFNYDLPGDAETVKDLVWAEKAFSSIRLKFMEDLINAK